MDNKNGWLTNNPAHQPAEKTHFGSQHLQNP